MGVFRKNLTFCFLVCIILDVALCNADFLYLFGAVMELDLSTLLSGATDRLDISYTMNVDFGDYQPVLLSGVSFGEVAVSGCIKDIAGYMSLELDISTSYKGECARCLTPVSGDLSFPFVRTVVRKGTLQSEEEEEYSDEYVILKDKKICVDSQIIDSIEFEFPDKLLCSPDCKGLCHKCGARLSEGDCGCSKKEHDHRWDALLSMEFPDEPEENNVN